MLALRSDLYDACDSVPGLAEVMHGSQVVVPPPTELELRRIVSSPARAAGVVLEPGLVDEVISNTGTAPGALALVSTALLESWTRRTGSTVTIDAYRAAGGVAGAIATLAEDAWANLDPEEQEQARSMLMRLAVGDAGDLTSPVGRDQLTSTDEAMAQRVLDRLVRRRLVTVDDDTVRLAHEALLREWPRLQRWLAEDRAVRDGLHHLRPRPLTGNDGVTTSQICTAGRDSPLLSSSAPTSSCPWPSGPSSTRAPTSSRASCRA